MKIWKISTLLATVALFAVTAFAANKGSLQTSEPLNLNGTTLKTGEYKVTWEGNGPDVEVSILRGKDVVAKTQGRLVDLPRAPLGDALVTKTNSDGSRSLSQIQFGGKKQALELNDQTSQANAMK
jgi:hypothetical protein